jgi:hypothetical protein
MVEAEIGQTFDRTSGFLCGASIMSQRDFVLSSHNSAKISEGSLMRCKANEQITMSITSGFEGSESNKRVPSVDSEGSGGKAPLAISLNESDAQGNDVRSR